MEFLYSDDFMTGSFLHASGRHLTEGLLGLRAGTCDPFAFLVAGTSQSSFDLPCFMLGGLVPRTLNDGQNVFDGDAGHAQACVILDGRPTPLDLTLECRRANFNPSLIPMHKRMQVLHAAKADSGLHVYDGGMTLRAHLQSYGTKEIKPKSIRGLLARTESRLRKITGTEKTPGASPFPASGHTFKITLPPISDLKEKIEALNFINYYTHFNQLISAAKKKRGSGISSSQFLSAHA